MMKFDKAVVISILASILGACSNEEAPIAHVEKKPETEESILRIERYLSGDATYAKLSINRPDEDYNSKFSLLIDTVDDVECAKLFEKAKPWTAYCFSAAKGKAPLIIEANFKQISAAGDEAYGGKIKASNDPTDTYELYLFPAFYGGAALRAASAPEAKIVFEDKTIRFQDNFEDASNAIKAISNRRKSN